MYFKVKVSKKIVLESGKEKNILETYFTEALHFAEAGYKVIQEVGTEAEVEDVCMMKNYKPAVNDKFDENNKKYERYSIGWRFRNPLISYHERSFQTNAPRIRQAYDLLPDICPDVGRYPRDIDYFHPTRFAGIPTFVGRRKRLWCTL